MFLFLNDGKCISKRCLRVSPPDFLWNNMWNMKRGKWRFVRTRQLNLWQFFFIFWIVKEPPLWSSPIKTLIQNEKKISSVFSGIEINGNKWICTIYLTLNLNNNNSVMCSFHLTLLRIWFERTHEERT